MSTSACDPEICINRDPNARKVPIGTHIETVFTCNTIINGKNEEKGKIMGTMKKTKLWGIIRLSFPLKEMFGLI